MPESEQDDVIPKNYERLLPKQEAPEAVAVGCLAWLFVVGFGCWLIMLDLNNLYNSGMQVILNMKYLWNMVRG